MSDMNDAVVQQALAYFKQWMFTDGGTTRPVFPANEFTEGMNNRYGLKNTQKDNEFLFWDDGRIGIDLNFRSEEAKRWIVSRCGDITQPIKYGETVSIGYGGSPTWVNHEIQTFGVNLGFQSSKSCEWIIFGGPIGTPVQTNQPVALFNTKSQGSPNVDGEFLLYGERHARHAPLVWPTSQPGILANLFGFLEDKLDDLVEEVFSWFSSEEGEERKSEPRPTPPQGGGVIVP